MTIRFPDDEYLRLVGQLAYAVAYLEGGVLFDLSRHAGVVPAALSPGALAGR